MKKVVLGLVLSATLVGSNVSASGLDTVKNAFGKTTTHVKNNKWTYGASAVSVAAISAAVAYDLTHDKQIFKVARATGILTANKYAQIKTYMKTNPKKAVAMLTSAIVLGVVGGVISADLLINGKNKSFTKAGIDKVKFALGLIKTTPAKDIPTPSVPAPTVPMPRFAADYLAS